MAVPIPTDIISCWKGKAMDTAVMASSLIWATKILSTTLYRDWTIIETTIGADMVSISLLMLIVPILFSFICSLFDLFVKFVYLTFLLFLIFLIVIFGVLVLRGVGLMLTARIGKSQMGFNSAMDIVGTAVLPQIPAFLVLFFLSFLLPHASTVTDTYAASQRPILVMMIVFAVFSVIVGESLLYLGQAKVANTEKSVFFMYVVLSTAFVLAGILVLYFGFSVLAPNPSSSAH